MTLPVQPVRGDSASLPLRGGSSRRRLSWADGPPPTRRERRRAICSWSIGYGTLSEQEESPAKHASKVADNASLLEPRGRRLTATNAASKLDLFGSLWRRSSSDKLVKQNGGVKMAASMANLVPSSSSGAEPLQPFNRLRLPPDDSSKFCSRCSSILTLASTSRYSLNSSGFVPVKETPLMCKLCLVEVPSKEACWIEDCRCSFCAECMRAYVVVEIREGAYDISCPDGQCPSKGVLHEEEIQRLAGEDLFEKHKKYRLNREIELDQSRTWCPRAGCETVCHLCPTQQCQPQSVHCPNCTTDFCSNCKLEWHDGLSCEQNTKKLTKEGRVEEPGIPFDSDLIKCCPMCKVPIEKDEGCAQMMCKRCKHVFCWYCLASLDDDFLLRHYDKGPCKNKLGHSRASVIWHRTQVIGIFAGFGILLLVASPLLLLAAPCIVCCKCRVCNANATKLDEDVEEVEEEQ